MLAAAGGCTSSSACSRPEVDRSIHWGNRREIVSEVWKCYNAPMIERVITKRSLHDGKADKRDLAYWLSQSLESRWNAVEFLRKHFYVEYPERLQRVYRVIKRK